MDGNRKKNDRNTFFEDFMRFKTIDYCNRGIEARKCDNNKIQS